MPLDMSLDIREKRVALERWLEELREKIRRLSEQQAMMSRDLAGLQHEEELARSLLKHLVTAAGHDHLAADFHAPKNAFLQPPRLKVGLQPLTIADAAYQALKSIDRAAHYQDILNHIQRTRLLATPPQPATLLTSMKRDARIERVEARGAWALNEWPEAKKQFDAEAWQSQQQAKELRDEIDFHRRIGRGAAEQVKECDEAAQALDDGDLTLAVEIMAEVLRYLPTRDEVRHAEPSRLRSIILRQRETAAALADEHAREEEACQIRLRQLETVKASPLHTPGGSRP